MSKTTNLWISAVTMTLLTGPVFALEEVKFGILHSNWPKEVVQAQWAPLATAMNKAIPGYKFVILVFSAAELSDVVATRQIDFILTNPTSYLLMFERSGLSAPLATLSDLEQGQPVKAFGGVIFTRAEERDIHRLEDIRSKTVASTSTDAFGGYQMQAYELSRIGINLRKDARLLITGQPHDKVVAAVLDRRADIGFVRTGILESLAREGKLDLHKISIINKQNLPGFPVSASTRLYPDWPVSALPQTSNYLKRKVAAFLLTIGDNSALAHALDIQGFDVPSNYTPVEDMLRELHLPPYNISPSFTARDVWYRYRWVLVTAFTSFTIILFLGLYSLLVNRRLKERSLDLDFANKQLQEEIVERKGMEDRISTLAFYDPLTQLPNRRLLMDRLSAALSISSRNQYYGALLFLDIDNFKMLNDTLGHDVGDLLLIEAASRIESSVREADTVARLGGDEFVMVIEGIDDHADTASQKVALLAEKIRAALSEPYQLGNNLYYSTPSIGVSLYLGNEKTVDELLKCADIALYQAKSSGRNAVRFFDPAMQRAVEEHAALEADLRQAILGRQLHLNYQIQVNSDLRPIGAEALVRWVHPTRGIVSPMEFIPIAEESKLILDIGNWVLDTACRQLSEWSRNEVASNISLAVNVSAQQFRQADFVDTVAAKLRIYALNASHLKLELTESMVLKDVKDVVTKMHALKAIGVTLAMDDFGTGYSSLSYLKQLPLDQLKIDQSFVRDMITDPNDAVMVKTIIDMAHNFRLHVIAEGVESKAQMDMLMKLGCKAFQGYYFSKPVPIEQFEALLKQS